MKGRRTFASIVLILGFAISGCGAAQSQPDVSAGNQSNQSAAPRPGDAPSKTYDVYSNTFTFGPNEKTRVVLDCPKSPTAPVVSGGYNMTPELSPDLILTASYPGKSTGMVKWYFRITNTSKDKSEKATLFVVCDVR
ncbi:MAG TPA: hypothetical protein VMU38_03245 [Candidatus Binatia bacterium]|nr:hypothetical protein [Candidatus Binatia bacterium]